MSELMGAISLVHPDQFWDGTLKYAKTISRHVTLC
jgi:hypothetical protein